MSKTIILIEDCSELRENIAEILELEGFDVLCAANADEGLNLIQTTPANVILCDILMPGTDGFTLLDNLIKTGGLNQTPFIFITALTDKAYVKKGLSMGAHFYLKKPFEAEELLDIVRYSLTTKQQSA